MPTFRPDLDRIPVYEPGRPIDEVARDLGIEDIVKLASNEAPLPPFPEVRRVIADAGAEVHRYPENSGYHLVRALADHLGISPDSVWLGAGSSQLINCIGVAVGGPGTSAVYGDPSFVMYPIATMVAGAEPVPVPLRDGIHDPDAMVAAVRADTTVLYLCNPNNPTGTHLPAKVVVEVIDAVPERVLVVVDEAYHEYVTAADHETAVPLAVERPNVVVTRTFSKIYSLAGLRIGYAVGRPETLRALRRTQIPFAANLVAQAAALEALRHPDQVERRREANAVGREELAEGLRRLGLVPYPSEANFVAVDLPDPVGIADALLRRGVIVRPLGSLVRITVGLPEENERCLAALGEIL